MKIEDSRPEIEKLDAPVDEELSGVGGLPVSEQAEESPEAEAQGEESQSEESQGGEATGGINIRDAVLEALQEVADAMPAQQQQPQTQAQFTRQQSIFNAKLNELRAQGVPEEALTNFSSLLEAHTAELVQALDYREQQRMAGNYNATLFGAVTEAIEEVGAAISPIKNAGQGARADLFDQAMRHIFQHPEFRTVKGAIDSARIPSKNELKKVAAKVVDQYCKDNGIESKPQGINIKSSKPDTSGNTKVDPRDMSKSQRLIYDINLQITGDPKKAMQRALATK